MIIPVILGQYTTPLQITNAGTTAALTIDQDGNGSSLSIDSEATSANSINVAAQPLTTGHVFNCSTADSLTTGRIISGISNASNDTVRTLGFLHNNNSAATGARVLTLQQDSTANGLLIDQDGNGIALNIDSECTSEPVIQLACAPTADTGFINFIATADADSTSAISTLTTSGATTHHVQCEVNGTKGWIAFSTNVPS